MDILKETTKSICPSCFKEITAKVIEENRQVYLLKKCAEHGEFKVLIEKDSSFYKRLMNRDFLEHQIPFINLAISITHLCDLNCNICYLPKRDDYFPSLESTKKVISEFRGEYIWLTGGEPLLRKDLLQIITYISENGKIPVILTNGLKLADKGYVRRLKKSGLGWFHFSFNGFNDDIYEKVNGKRLLKTKLEALRNIKKAKIPTVLSVILVKGINDNELGKIYRYCLKNTSFIFQLRIRSAVHVGKHTQAECLYLSEIVKMMSTIIGISEEKVINHALGRGLHYSLHGEHHMPCHLEIDLFSLLMEEIEMDGIGNSIIKKIRAIFRLLPKIGLRNFLKMVLAKLAGKKRLLEFTIRIRTWPDKHRIDLGEIQRCASGYATCDGNRILPFCYALVLNEKKHLL